MSFPDWPKRRSLLVIGAAAVAVMTSVGCTTTELPGAAQPRGVQARAVDTDAIGMSGANAVRAAVTTFSDDFDGSAGADVDGVAADAAISSGHS